MTNSIVRMSEREREKLTKFCRERDVNRGGCFDVRGDADMGAVNCWSVPWLDEASCRLSECVGTIWLKPDRVEIEGEVPTALLGLSVSEVKRELALLTA